jgi:hypothetical protein
MRKTIAALMLTGACFTPAFAQTQTPTKTPTGQVGASGECQTNFKAADKNADGSLSKAEMTAASKVVPTSLVSQNSVTQAQFLTACNAGRSKGG